MKQPFHSVRELGQRWTRSSASIVNDIKAGKLAAIRLSNRGRTKYLVPTSEIERLERAHKRMERGEQS
jgi:hypothetical protein